MTGYDDFDRRLAAWFEADALSPAPAGALDRVVAATRRRGPRPAWLAGPGSHWVGEAHTAGSSSGVRTVARSDLRWSTALILLLATLALVGGAILVGARLTPPSPIPTGGLGRLAYELDGDIYVADWDARNPIRIGSASSTENCEAAHLDGGLWSPDGRYLAYRSGSKAGCTPSVHISDAQGKVVASWAAAVGWDVAWAPDSRRVVAWGTVDGTIDIRGVDGVLQAELTLPEGCVCGDYDPMWAHDARAILIRLIQGDPFPPRPTQYWRLPIPGGSPSPLRDGAGSSSIHGLVYSADGTQAAFWTYGPDGSLVITSADDMTVARAEVKAQQIAGLIWSPTGDRIAVTTVRDRIFDQNDPVGLRIEDLQLLDVARGQLTMLATAREPGAISPLAFSPDGDRILFSQTDAKGQDSLWSMDTDGSDAQLLVTGTATGDWQPSPAGP